MSRVFVTIPDFGYGPVCCAADLVGPIRERSSFEFALITSGNARAFLRANEPGAEILNIDVFDESRWESIDTTVGPGAPIVCISQPPLAEWLAGRGHQVFLVDQLDWMWTDRTPAAHQLAGHIVQAYFGFGPGTQAALSITPTRPPTRAMSVVRPILNSAFTGLAALVDPVAHFETVVAFGGMAVAGKPSASDAYAAWLLDTALPSILSATEGRVAVVGGSSMLDDVASLERWGANGRVALKRGVSRTNYAQLLAGSAHQILSPGLATIYEADALGVGPLFQLGGNKSMLLQAEDLIAQGYEWVARWPWQAATVAEVRNLPQRQALKVIDALMFASMEGRDGAAERFRDEVVAYFDTTSRPRLDLSASSAPLAHEVLGDWLAGVLS